MGIFIGGDFLGGGAGAIFTEPLQKQSFADVLQKDALKNFGNFTAGVYFFKTCRLKACNFIKKIPTQVFFREVCEIFKNTFFTELR